MKNICIAFIICALLTSCLEVEEQSLVVNQNKHTATLYLHNITSDEKGEKALEDFKVFMDAFESGKVLNEFFLDRSDLGTSILKKKIYQRRGQLHAKIEFHYRSLEQLGFNTCFYDDPIAQTVVLNEKMQDRVYFHMPTEITTMFSFYTNALISNSFMQVFDSETDLEDFSNEDLASRSLVFSWEKYEPIKYTYFTPIDSSNTSMLNYWKENK